MTRKAVFGEGKGFPLKAIDPKGKAVVITGCSSGIGRAAALHLAGLL